MVPKPKRTNKKDRSVMDEEFANEPTKCQDRDINVKPPSSMVVASTGMTHTWKKWKQLWHWYYVASGLYGKFSNVQVASFMPCLGPDVIEIYNTFGFPDDEVELDEVILAFDKFFIGKSNEVFERYLFNKVEQENGQSFENFYTKLENNTATCNFGNLKDSLIRDRIVIGVLDLGLKDKTCVI